ncbi:MAG TPA: glycine cleavage system aminomethyltransferase GcvT [Candidatus Polarisedimenticolaceae bacterium]|nr:glycine cleavage system aminomethyltransferase GcvT [Candidatus Polarisedimenticolaceae bacterium]
MTADGGRPTPLHELHLAAGARMVDFAGWHMPVQYAGVIEEHLAVRSAAGLFDVSHMGEVRVSGPHAPDYLQAITPNDVARLTPGRAHYNALTTPAGTFIDDLLVYRLGEREFMLVLNAANTAKDIAWLQQQAARFDVRVEPVSEQWALLALQGPRARAILARRLDGLDALRYYGFAEREVAGASWIVSRTGYTGEDGFEIYLPPDAAPRLWTELLEAGRADGLQPIGLGARDTLRLEAKMALYGNDIDDTTTVLEADLGWIVKLDKGEFVGRDVLARQAREGVARRLVGFEMLGRAIARHGYAAHAAGREVGRVTSGSPAPFLKKNIGLVYLPSELAAEGTPFEVDVRGRREPARVVPTPFYKRARG